MTPSLAGSPDTRSISWVKVALKDFASFPDGAQREILGALTIAAEGRKADIAKPMNGLGAGVFEVALKYRSDAYRTVYALRLGEDIWVLHAFQQKAKQGIKTPRKHVELIRRRISRLQEELKR